jgi:hypothetical protein
VGSGTRPLQTKLFILKKSAKTRKLGAWFSLHRVGGDSRKPTKTREKSKIAENQVFWLDFCAKKDCAYTLWIVRVLCMRWPASMSPLRLEVKMFNFLLQNICG